MRRILAATSFCTLVLLATTCSDESNSPDAGGTSPTGGGPVVGGGMDSGNPGGTAGGGSSGGGSSGGGSSGGGATGGGDGGAAAGGGDGGGAAGGGDAGQPGACDPSSAPEVGKLKLETVVSGVSRLMYAAQPPGSSDWWLVQQNGQIRVLPAGASMPTATALLDIGAATITTNIGGEDERGLLGLAFAPDFATSGLFYVMLTPNTGEEINRDQVRQYKKDGDSVTLQAKLLNLAPSERNHNGGNIAFGPDGMLYVGTGDGGGSCNSNLRGAPQLISSDENALFGKILRLDPSNAPSYAAAGNPFAENPLVWHYGLRNPFRFSFDRATGDLYIGDVGQLAYEELDFAKSGAKGLNFGWATYEAEAMTCRNFALRAGSTQTEPIFAADRRAGGCAGRFCDWKSIIGGVVYRGTALAQLAGVYVFGDYKGVRMVALRQCDSGTSPPRVIGKECDPNAPSEACFSGASLADLIAVVEDNAGEMYLVANKSSLFKVVPGP